MWFLNLCQWGRSATLLEMVCSHSFLYFSSSSSQETQTVREGKPQMTLVYAIAKNGSCLNKGCYLTCMVHFSTYSSTAHVTNNDGWTVIVGLAVWDAHWEMKHLFLSPLICSPNSTEFSLSSNMAGLEEGPYLLLLLWVNKYCKKPFSNVESNTEINLLPLCS